jgi:hypothetical protein
MSCLVSEARTPCLELECSLPVGYRYLVRLCLGFRAKCLLVPLVCLLFYPVVTLHAKSVRLRNGTIDTGEPARAAATLPSASPAAVAAEPPVSGLFLVQFKTPPTPAMLQQLEESGAKVLQYIPDDTFLVRMHSAPLRSVRAVSNVHWLGQYAPEHKLDRSLELKLKNSPDPLANVAVLLAPDLNAGQLAVTRKLLGAVRQQSKLRSGMVLRGKIVRTRLVELARSDAVLWIEEDRDMKLYDEVASKLVAGDGGTGTLLTESLGYDGSGARQRP